MEDLFERRGRSLISEYPSYQELDGLHHGEVEAAPFPAEAGQPLRDRRWR